MFIGSSRKGVQLCNNKHLWDSCSWENGVWHVQSYVKGQCCVLQLSMCTEVVTFSSLCSSSLCFCLQCHPAESLKMFVPHCCNAINQIAVSKWPPHRSILHLQDSFTHICRLTDTCIISTDEEVLNEEELDKELLWNLQLLSEVI